ncbi:uncharacterized WD repeat-containing protein-like protein isoform X4 [Tanacetum coccineum]
MWLFISWESSRPVVGVKVNSSSGHPQLLCRILILRPKLIDEECDRAPDNRSSADATNNEQKVRCGSSWVTWSRLRETGVGKHIPRAMCPPEQLIGGKEDAVIRATNKGFTRCGDTHETTLKRNKIEFVVAPYKADAQLVFLLDEKRCDCLSNPLGVDLKLAIGVMKKCKETRENDYLELRNLLWATSKHDLYHMQNYSVMHWSSLLKRGKEVINVAMPVLPTLMYPGSFSRSLSRVQVSTMAVKDDLIVAGGFYGELICKYKVGLRFLFIVVTRCLNVFFKIGSDDAILDDQFLPCSGAMRVMTDASYGCLMRRVLLALITSRSPGVLMIRLLALMEINKMNGHVDYSFASAWHPNVQIVATGNQDTTCRLWDIRNPSESLAVLKGRMGEIRAIRFSADGRYLAIAETADFVLIFDSQTDYG